MTTSSRPQAFCDFFCDPYEISTSFQLSDKLRRGDKLQWINCVRDADVALQNREYRVFLRLIKPVIAFLNSNQRHHIIRRIIYNHLYLKPFEPVIFALPLRKSEGRFSFEYQPSIHLELDFNIQAIKRILAKESRKYFHDLYGLDITGSLLSMRFSKVVTSQKHTSRVGDKQIELEPIFRDANPNFLHLDEKKGITTILYLSDVSASNGAFRYVEGSHQAKISPILKSFHEFIYNDLKIATYEDVLAFPLEFRAGINYYYWLEPEKRKVIDSFTRTLTGSAGTAISFAGNRLLHGGGIPYFGERTALFIGHVGYVCHRLRQLLHPLSILQRLGYGN